MRGGDSRSLLRAHREGRINLSLAIRLTLSLSLRMCGAKIFGWSFDSTVTDGPSVNNERGSLLTLVTGSFFLK